MNLLPVMWEGKVEGKEEEEGRGQGEWEGMIGRQETGPYIDTSCV